MRCRIRNQSFRTGFRISIHLIPIQIQRFYDQKIDNKLQLKKTKILFDQKLQFTVPIPSSPYRTYKLKKKPSDLKRERLALENIKFLNVFLLLWVIFALIWIRNTRHKWRVRRSESQITSFLTCKQYSLDILSPSSRRMKDENCYSGLRTSSR